MSEPIIELHELTKKYGKFTAVDHINLAVQKGEIFGILGPNGAGKSTTILMMLGLTDPTSGTVQVCGINSTRNPIQVREKVGYLPEDVGFYDDMTGIENLLYTARLNRIPEADARNKAEELLERVGLPVDTQKKAGKYSRGMRQRLGLADVLIKQPEVIILDEPTSGVDPVARDVFWELIIELSRRDKVTIFITTHFMNEAERRRQLHNDSQLY